MDAPVHQRREEKIGALLRAVRPHVAQIIGGDLQEIVQLLSECVKQILKRLKIRQAAQFEALLHPVDRVHAVVQGDLQHLGHTYHRRPGNGTLMLRNRKYAAGNSVASRLIQRHAVGQKELKHGAVVEPGGEAHAKTADFHSAQGKLRVQVLVPANGEGRMRTLHSFGGIQPNVG